MLRHLSTAVMSAALLANAAACVVEIHAATMLTSKSPWGRVAAQRPRPRLEASADIFPPQVARWPTTFLHESAETETLTSHRAMKRGGSAPCSLLSAAMMRVRTGRARMRMRTRQHFAHEADAPIQFLLTAVLSASLSANGAASAQGMRVQHTTHNVTNARDQEIRITPGSIIPGALEACVPTSTRGLLDPKIARICSLASLLKIKKESAHSSPAPVDSCELRRSRGLGSALTEAHQAVHQICFERPATQSCPRA